MRWPLAKRYARERVDETLSSRTAKSCGSGAPTQASSSRNSLR